MIKLRRSFKNWPDTTSDCDWARLEIIERLLAGHPKLIDWLFKDAFAETTYGPQEMVERAACYSSGEQTLIKLALDIWSSSQYASVHEMCRRLDDASFKRCLFAMVQFREI